MVQNFNWSKLLKVLIAVLTAIAGSIGVVSCVGGLTPSLSQGEGVTTIVANVMSHHHEIALLTREA